MTAAMLYKIKNYEKYLRIKTKHESALFKTKTNEGF